jgi:TolB-like protein/Tfp pilus assembly protein PilF
MPPVRRLTAILAADVAGYSRLMGADEEGTHERLRAHVGELVNPKIGEHRGRMVKNTGDGFLAEFASVVGAVRCAVEMQRGMADRNAGTPPEKRIEFRVGVNLGDVIAEGEDIFGDGVNIAARLEALAEPGGICVSRVVRDQIRDKLPYAFEDMGEQSVKNIARPVRVYALRPQGIAGVATTRMSSTSSSPPAAAPRLSIVVLPFTNLSDDREQQYFADGITEDLTTDLSRIAGMIVISRNTAFTYRNKPVDTKQIGRELSVRYVLEGSVRRSGNQIRINAQVIDAETDTHLWAERFNSDVADLIALQEEVTSRIAVALSHELPIVEAARPTVRPDVLDYILRARAADAKPKSRERNTEVMDLLERALALHPHSFEAQCWLASSLVSRIIDDLTDTAAADLVRAEGLVERALAASPRSSLPHFARAQVLRAQRRYAAAIPEYETALALNPNHVTALFALGQCKLFTGSIEETIPLVERAIRLSPRDPNIVVWWHELARVHLLQSRIGEAILWLEKACSVNPVLPYVHSHLASAYALKGEAARATAELAEARRLSRDGRYSTIARLKLEYPAFGSVGVPEIRALIDATYFAGLRKAGVPEE